MSFQWRQLPSRAEEMGKWVLIHKDSGRAVLLISLSRHADPHVNWKLRKKIQCTYEMYYGKVGLMKLRFF
uniref:hypothetical protein n=1 Tax=Acetatifactor sp. TaxID=1872090 RepID=UPI004055D9C8